MISGEQRASLRGDVRDVREDLRRLHARGRAPAPAQASTIEAKAHLHDVIDAAAARARRGVNKAQDHVRGQPVPAIAAAFGVGLVVGLFLLNRRC